MILKRWSKSLLVCGVLLLGGCQGEVPVPMEEQAEKPEASSPPSSPGPAEAGFQTLLFENFSKFVSQPAEDEETWSVTEEGIIRTTGTPRGYLYTNESFEDFTFRCEFRYVPPEEPLDAEGMEKYNTGFLIYVPDEHKLWPRSLEVQGRYDEMGQVKSNARDVMIDVPLDDEEARQEARNPVGEWNAVEIRSDDGAVSAFLNGTKISECEPGELKSGRIGLQAEDYPVEFRNLRIRPE